MNFYCKAYGKSVLHKNNYGDKNLPDFDAPRMKKEDFIKTYCNNCNCGISCKYYADKNLSNEDNILFIDINFVDVNDILLDDTSFKLFDCYKFKWRKKYSQDLSKKLFFQSIILNIENTNIVGFFFDNRDDLNNLDIYNSTFNISINDHGEIIKYGNVDVYPVINNNEKMTNSYFIYLDDFDGLDIENIFYRLKAISQVVTDRFFGDKNETY